MGELLHLVLRLNLKMSFKSMLQYVKDQFWSICWKSFGSRLKRVSSMETIDDDSKKQSIWADNMPPELLTEILMRIEASESEWPSRKNVVSCAGVCRSWRRNVKEEIVKCPQLSGKLTFPISLEQPGSVGSLTRCIIKRVNNEVYHLFLRLDKDPMHQGRKLLLSAKRVSCGTCTKYIISYNHKDISKGSDTYLGMLRSNFLGTKFTVYDAHPPNYLVSSISYKVNALGNRGPRKMRCEINKIFPANSFSSAPLVKLKDVKLLFLKYTPMWDTWQSKLWRWCLNFVGHVTFASAMNFELVACLDDDARVLKEDENIILRFTQLMRQLSYMDYRYPISAFQAFAICLSSFDTKVACE